MRPAWDVRGPLRGWQPAAVLAAVLLGLAAMHGLAPHGALGHDTGAGLPVHTDGLSAGAAPSTHGGQASVPLATGSETANDLGSGRPAEPAAGEPVPGQDAAIQACVAVLLVAGAVLLTLRLRSTRPALLVPRWPSRAVVESDRLCHPHPPSLAQLAVLRC